MLAQMRLGFSGIDADRTQSGWACAFKHTEGYLSNLFNVNGKRNGAPGGIRTAVGLGKVRK